MGVFSSVGTAQGASGGSYFPGEFLGLLECVRCKHVVSKNPKKAGDEFFVLEAKILESKTHPELVGKTRTLNAKVTGPWADFGLADTANALAAFSGVDKEDVDEAMVFEACGKDEDGEEMNKGDEGYGGTMLSGAQAWLETTTKEREGKNPITQHSFTAVD